jgi:hypothetical protein
MSRRLWIPLWAIIVSSQLLAGAVAFAASNIEIWTRGSGQHGDDADVKRGNPRAIEQSGLTKSRLKLNDSQYKKSFTYDAIKVKDIVSGYQPSDPSADAIILHFKNGMAVPVRTDSSIFDKLYVAFAICETEKQGKGKAKCTREFPDLSKDDPLFAQDPRPVKFTNNKLVSLSTAHPYVKPGSNFSPWHHVDTLVGIEFIRESAYFDQFDPGGPEGREVFKNRCAYCHSVRHVGGRFGWDFVDPVAVYQLKTPENLFNHVKYPKAHALNDGLLMPHQKDINEREAKALWEWMKQLATKPLKAYK